MEDEVCLFWRKKREEKSSIPRVQRKGEITNGFGDDLEELDKKWKDEEVCDD